MEGRVSGGVVPRESEAGRTPMGFLRLMRGGRRRQGFVRIMRIMRILRRRSAFRGFEGIFAFIAHWRVLIVFGVGGLLQFSKIVGWK